MARRYYSSVAVATYLTLSVGTSDTTFQVNAITGYPASFPYTLVIEPDTANEEVCTVTASAGTQFTVIRGVDGSTPKTHTASTGTAVQHRVSAREFDEANAHINSTTGVHGLSGALVGTLDVQTLTHKDLTDATNTFPTSLARTASPSLTSAVLDAASTIGGISGTTIAADHAALQAGTATYVPAASFGVSLAGRFKLMGAKFGYLNVVCTGAMNATTSLAIALPPGWVALADEALTVNSATGATGIGSNSPLLNAKVAGGTSTVFVTAGGGFGIQNGTSLNGTVITGFIELQ